MKQRSIFWIWMAAVLATLQACGQAETDDAVTAKLAAFSATGEVLSFETLSGWTTNKGNISLDPNAVHGNHSLAVSYGGDATLTSIPIGPVSPVDTHVTLDLLQPTTHPNPWWRGTVKLAIVSPSLGMYWQELPEVSLQGHPLGQFVRLSFPIPVNVRTQLNSQNPTDLTIKVLLNVPMGAGPWLVDRLSFGTVEEPEPPADDDPPSDDDPPADDEPTTDDDSSTDDLPDASIDDPPTDDPADDDPADDDPVTDDPGTDDPPPDDGTVPGTSHEFFIKWPATVDLETILLGSYGGDLRIGDSARIIGTGGPDSRANVTAVDGGGLSRLGVGGQVAGIWSDSPQHGPTQIATGAHVFGNITTSAGTVDVQSGALLDGVIYDNQPLGPLATEQWSVFFPDDHAGAVNVSSSNSPVDLPPGAYGELNISSGGVLVLSPGQYTFETIGSWNGSAITLDNAAGPIQVYARNALTLQGPITRTAPEANVLVGFAGHGYAWLQNDANLNFALVAPWGTVTIHPPDGNNTGSVFAKSINADATQDYVLQPFSGALLCGADSECSTLCPCGKGTPCDSNAECLSNECTDGVCVCTPDCTGKVCGDDVHDGCGGVCPGLCDDVPGCVGSADCSEGMACVPLGGPQRGFAAGTSACLPTACLDMDPSQPNCGIPDGIQCGPCAACQPLCDGKTCGPDRCGGTCGELTGDSSWCALGNEAQFHIEDGYYPAGFPDALDPASAEPTTHGTVPGRFWVSDSGNANYRVPIEAPPGRSGLTPSIALSYSSNQVNSLAGLGWRIDGLSSVSLCPRIYADRPTGIGEATHDAYCIDGIRTTKEPLGGDVPPEIAGEADSELRIERSPFERVFLLSGSGTRPRGFKKYTRDGLIYTYGELPEDVESTQASIVKTDGMPRLWALTKVEDRSGASIRIEYDARVDYISLSPSGAEQVTEELRPRAIHWGGHDEAGHPHDRQISFLYEPRPDYEPHYVHGSRTNLNKRLASIQVSFEGQLIRTYVLGYYPTDEAQPRSRLNQVQLCAPDASGPCLPATTFEYNEAPPVGDEQEFTTDLVNWFRIGEGSAALPLDCDRDGADEVMVVPADFVENPQQEVTCPALPDTFPDDLKYFTTHVADFNQDGRDDIVLYYSRSSRANSVLAYMAGESSFSETELAADVRWSAVGDFDGDGKKELFLLQETQGLTGMLYRSAPNGSWSGIPLSLPENVALASQPLVLDRDGDGDDDLIVGTAQGPMALVLLGKPGENTWEPIEYLDLDGQECTDCLWEHIPPIRVLLDANGDGLTDYFTTRTRFGSTHHSDATRIWINTGRGFRAEHYPVGDLSTRVSTLFAFDYDADGRDDLLWGDQGVVVFSREKLGDLRFEASEPLFELEFDELLTIADVNGDGEKDLVRLANLLDDSIKVRYRPGGVRRANLLKEVTDGVGKTIQIDYSDSISAGEPGPDGLVFKTYEPDFEFHHNTIPIKEPGPLVAVHREMLTPNAPPRVTHYTYSNARLDNLGRGSLGFETRKIRELAPDDGVPPNAFFAPFRETTLAFHNEDHVRAGLVASSTTTFGRVEGNSYYHDYTRRITRANDWQWLTSPFRPWLGGQQVVVEDFVNGGYDPIHRIEVTRAPDEYDNVALTRTAYYLENNTEPVEVRELTFERADIPEFWMHFSPERILDSSQAIKTGPDPVVRETRFAYYDNGELQAIVREPEAVGTNRSDQYQRTELFRQGPLWNVEAVTVSDAEGAEREESVIYDSRGLFPVQLVNPALHTTSVRLSDFTGRPLTLMDPNGVVTQFRYDQLGRLREQVTPTDVTITRYRSPNAGACPSSSEGVMCLTRAVYDNDGANLDALTAAENGYTATMVDGFGRVVSQRRSGFDHQVIEQEYVYDWRSRLTGESLPHLPGDSSQGWQTYTYDPLDRLTAVQQADDRTTYFYYFSRAAALYGRWLFDGSATGTTTEAVIRERPDGTEDSIVLDYAGRPAAVVELDDSPSSMFYEYGPFGVVKSVSAPEALTTFTWDEIGRRRSVSRETLGTTYIEYSGFDEPIQRTNGNDEVFCQTFDVLGRLTSVLEPDASGGCESPESQLAGWLYDERPSCSAGDPDCLRLIGKLVESWRATDPESPDPDSVVRTAYHYETDPATPGRIASIERHAPALADPMVTGFSYDYSRLKSVAYPSAEGDPLVVTYNYDAHGYLQSVGTPGTTFWRLDEADQGFRIGVESLGNGVTNDYEYYSLLNQPADCGADGTNACEPGALRSILTRDGASQRNYLEYEYNRRGQVSSRVTGYDVGSQIDALQESFTYDVHDQLRTYTKTTWAFGGPVQQTEHQYVVSGGGNIQEVYIDDQLTDEYTYSNARLSSFNGRDLDYDGSGRITNHDREGGLTDSYSYNDFDMPWRVETGPDTAFLEYDAFQTRVAKRGPDKTTLYAGDVYECDGASAVFPDDPIVCETERLNVYVGSRQVAQITRELGGEETIAYVHTDSLGSAVLVTDEDGDITSRRHFDPFGRPDVDLSSTSLSRGFTGHEHDTDLALINMKGRLYDPELRRFTTPDPMVGQPLSLQGWNAYAYVENNPVNLVDPSGFMAECAGCFAGPDYGGGQSSGDSTARQLSQQAWSDSFGNSSGGSSSRTVNSSTNSSGHSESREYWNGGYGLSYGYGGPDQQRGGAPVEYGPTSGLPTAGSIPSTPAESGGTPSPGTNGTSGHSFNGSNAGPSPGADSTGRSNALAAGPAAPVIGGAVRACLASPGCAAILGRVLTVLIGVGLEVVQNQEDRRDGEEAADVPADKLTTRQIDQLKKRLDKGETIESMKEAVTGRPAGRSDLFIEPDGAITVRPKSGPGVRRRGEPTGFTVEDLR